MTIDQTRLEAFLHKMVSNMGAAAIGSLVLWATNWGSKTIAQAGPITSVQLARQPPANAMCANGSGSGRSGIRRI